MKKIFTDIPQFAPDSILGLSKIIVADKRKNIINATIGVAKTETGEIFVPSAIKNAAKTLPLEPVSYLSPKNEFEWLGDENYLRGSIDLILSPKQKSSHTAAIGTVGGTNAVYTALDAYKECTDTPTILISSPTWPNHLGIAETLGYKIETYTHVQNNTYDSDGHLAAIKKLPRGGLVLFHAAKTHNPTGIGPDTNDWKILAKEMEGKVALFDSAYLGLGDSLDKDGYGIRYFVEQGIETFVALSYSKNAGLYNQRTGAVIVPVSTQAKALKMQRLLNAVARKIYSNPPAQGERLMAALFQDQNLLKNWVSELEVIRETIQERRVIFSELVPQCNFVKNGRGLFSLLPPSLQQVEILQKDHGVYLTNSGRINIGGITKQQIPVLANAIKTVLN